MAPSADVHRTWAFFTWTATTAPSWPRSRSRSREAGKPGSREAGKPGSREAGKPGSREAGKPGSREAGKPGSREAGKPGSREAGKPGSREAGKPGSREAGTRAGKPGSREAGKPGSREAWKPGAPRSREAGASTNPDRGLDAQPVPAPERGPHELEVEWERIGVTLKGGKVAISAKTYVPTRYTTRPYRNSCMLFLCRPKTDRKYLLTEFSSKTLNGLNRLFSTKGIFILILEVLHLVRYNLYNVHRILYTVYCIHNIVPTKFWCLHTFSVLVCPS